MAKHQLVINMNGGLVQDVFGTVPDVQVLVVDWDAEGSLPDEPGSVDVPLRDGSSPTVTEILRNDHYPA